jgi:hypothetical protein
VKGQFSVEFMSSRPDVIRSADQRRLLQYWNSRRSTAILPVWDCIEVPELDAISGSLSYADVVAASDHPRFLIRYHGARVAELYGAVCIGKHLDEVLPPAYRTSALATYYKVVNEKLPVYTVADTRDRGGRIVHYERLLLPFGSDGRTVDRILVSLETVSPEGAFENRGLMAATQKPPAFALCTTIQY